jgi:phage/plasmid-like protein (TIGR03299 family)
MHPTRIVYQKRRNKMSPANMGYVGEMPWHKEGNFIGDFDVTSEEMIVKSGLDWEVGTMDLFTKSSGEISFEIPVPDMKAIVRLSDYSVLGVTGNRFTPVQNRNSFNFFDTIVGEKRACYHTAGSLLGGKKIWILASIPTPMVVGKNDVLEKYLLLSNAHDGKHALEMLATNTRVCCCNTLAIALAEGRAKSHFRITHSNSVQDKLKQAEYSFAAAEKFYLMFNEHANIMAKYQYSPFQLKELVEKLFPNDENDEVSKKTQEKRDKIVYLYENGKGSDIQDIRGSAWNAVNAVSEFTDHYMSYRGKDKEDRRLNSIWYGNAANLKQIGWDFVTSQMNV